MQKQVHVVKELNISLFLVVELFFKYVWVFSDLLYIASQRIDVGRPNVGCSAPRATEGLVFARCVLYLEKGKLSGKWPPP
jgi:hypothetical protein